MATSDTVKDATNERAPGKPLDVARLRKDFPILRTEVGGKPLVYLDNAASAQKPHAVIDAITEYYTLEHANIHRGVHYLSARATDAYDRAREKVARFINAPEARECVFVRGCTEAINLVANGFGATILKPGDEIVLTELEHHANIVPWQMAAARSGAVIRVAPIHDDGSLDMDAYAKLLNDKTRIVSFLHVSNALGIVTEAKKMIDMAHAAGAAVLLDVAQSVPHMTIDVQALGADFIALSGHKLFGPTGIGVLWGRAEWLEKLPPYQGGGDMIDKVTFEKTTYRGIPEKFEAGTPHISGVVGLGAAVDYLLDIGMDHIAAYEHELYAYAVEQLAGVPDIRPIGTAKNRTGAISFLLGDVHPHDIGTFLDADGIAIRAGHHCTQPLMRRLGVNATARASFAFYNTREEVDALAACLRKIAKFFT